MPRWFDTHVHLDQYPEADRPELLARAAAAGVEAVVAIGGLGPQRVAVSPRGVTVYRAAGVHPRVAPPAGIDRDWCVATVQAPDIVAVGEIGFDAAGPPMPIQRKVFSEQVSVAEDVGKTVVLHIDGPGAFTALAAAWNEVRAPPRLVRHYFTGDAGEARWHVERGHYLSFGRPLLREPALQEIAHDYPWELILSETDSYPLPGRTTEPRDLPEIGAVLAQLRGWTVAECAERLWENSARAFGLD